MFPGQLRDRVLQQASSVLNPLAKRRKLSELSDEETDDLISVDKQEQVLSKSDAIADLFLNTTIVFVDIVGFTAWSSNRQPTHVFNLLETVFRAFDKQANKHGIFKVETVGECYVAVSGLPNPRKDHAVAICRFARNCVHVFRNTTKNLETTLGPDTGYLNIRVGIHSGPVTAGVLRGNRSRFQLFGDTMNTTSRMETNCKPGRIQISRETAELLCLFHKDYWIQERSDLIEAKGKGALQTFWLSLYDDKEGPPKGMTADEKWELVKYQNTTKELVSKRTRLVDWNVQIMSRLLKEIVYVQRTYCFFTCIP